MLGLGPTAIKEQRRRVGATAGIATRGICLTTAIALAMGSARDPGIAIPRAAVAHFFDLWVGHAELHADIKEVWPGIVREHFAQRAWKDVGGPVAAAYATLRDAGWTPTRPDTFFDGSGGQWQLIGDGPMRRVL